MKELVETKKIKNKKLDNTGRAGEVRIDSSPYRVLTYTIRPHWHRLSTAMAPKGQRGAGTSQLRTHSRSSSATKLGGNIQFTQKDVQPQGRSDKLPKKNGFEVSFFPPHISLFRTLHLPSS